MANGANPIEIRDLVKRFGKAEALRGVTLSLPAGTVTGLLGKNGAGKTTLIKCVLGLLRPSGGGCRILGDDSGDLSPAVKARIGYVPQEPMIYPWMRIRQAIAYQGAFYPQWNGEIIARLLKAFELDETKRVGILSVGQLQKLAILLALASDPDVLVLDEPVAALDPEGRRAFLKLLLELVADGDKTVVLSTHITSDVERACSHVAILREGELLHMQELDSLKDSVKEVRVSGGRGVPAGFSHPAVLRASGNGAGVAFVAGGDVAGLAAALRNETGGEVSVIDLNLEDVFLELHR